MTGKNLTRGALILTLAALLTHNVSAGIVGRPGIGVGIGFHRDSSGAVASTLQADFDGDVAAVGVQALIDAPTLTVDGTDVTPLLMYNVGNDCDATDCDPSTYGPTVELTDIGTDPSFNQGSPGMGTNDDGVLFVAAGDYYSNADDTTAGDITTEDIIYEAVGVVQGVAEYVGMGKTNNGANDPGWTIYSDGNGINFRMNDGTGGVIETFMSGGIEVGTWVHCMGFIDRSGSGQQYCNGIAGNATSMAVATDSLSNSVALSIGADSDGDSSWANKGPLAYAAVWTGDDLLDSHLHPEIAEERFAMFNGTMLVSSGDGWQEYPNETTRASTAILEKVEGTAIKYYRMGDNWPRISQAMASGVTPSTSTRYQGLWSERQKANQILQSQDASTTWTVANVSSIDTDEVATPDGEITMDGISASVVNSTHKIKQTVTLTAETWVFSVTAKSAEYSWTALQALGASAFAYFDLDDCGTVGTAVNTIDTFTQDLGNGLCRVSISFTGNAGTSAMEIFTARDNFDASYAGDGAASPDIHVGDMQVIKLDAPGSVIATTTGTVQRKADSVTYTSTTAHSAGLSVAANFLMPHPVTIGNWMFVGGVSDGTETVSASVGYNAAGDPVCDSNAPAYTVTGTTSDFAGPALDLECSTVSGTSTAELFVGGSTEGTPASPGANHVAIDDLTIGQQGAAVSASNYECNCLVGRVQYWSEEGNVP